MTDTSIDEPHVPTAWVAEQIRHDAHAAGDADSLARSIEAATAILRDRLDTRATVLGADDVRRRVDEILHRMWHGPARCVNQAEAAAIGAAGGYASTVCLWGWFDDRTEQLLDALAAVRLTIRETA